MDDIRARPWPIHGFALILLGLGLYGLIVGLLNADLWLETYRELLPDFPWDSDWVIVALSARFTIICIPMVAIWGFRSSIARFLITTVTAFVTFAQGQRIFTQGPTGIDGEVLTNTLFMLFACGLLFTPSSRNWLAGR